MKRKIRAAILAAMFVLGAAVPASAVPSVITPMGWQGCCR